MSRISDRYERTVNRRKLDVGGQEGELLNPRRDLMASALASGSGVRGLPEIRHQKVQASHVLVVDAQRRIQATAGEVGADEVGAPDGHGLIERRRNAARAHDRVGR